MAHNWGKQQIAVLTIKTASPSIDGKSGPGWSRMVSVLGRMSPLPWRPRREPKNWQARSQAMIASRKAHELLCLPAY
jgi:hypothetical protein